MKAVERLLAYRAKRPAGKVQDSLRNLADAAKGGDNLMGRIHQCVKSECTLGEISDELRKVYGEYQEYSGF